MFTYFKLYCCREYKYILVNTRLIYASLKCVIIFCLQDAVVGLIIIIQNCVEI